jgi:hypothetical protein
MPATERPTLRAGDAAIHISDRPPEQRDTPPLIFEDTADTEISPKSAIRG